MKNFFKTSILVTLTAMLFQSCESDEFQEDFISDEQKISTDLAQKVMATSNSLNDYDFFVTNVNSTECEFPSTLCYFSNSQGDYYQFLIMADSFDNWLSEYNQAKLEALNTSGIEFIDDDFVLEQINIETGFFGFTNREHFLEYFENCDKDPDFGSTTEFGVPFLDIDSNCNDNEITLTLAGESLTITNTEDLTPIESFLNTVNENNNENYTLEDILISTITYEAPNGEEAFLLETEDILNYFDDCLFNRSTNNEGCLKFIYPLDINRFSLELEEVITTTIQNDEELINTFSIEVGELGFVYPISLLGQNENSIQVETNAALEIALDDSSTYCN